MQHTADMQFKIPIGLVAFGLFFLGLIVSFFLSGIIGAAAPITWAGVVLLFFFMVYSLQRPKLYVWIMLLAYGLFFNFRSFFGVRVIPVYLPMEGIFEELFFIIPLAIILLRFTHHQQPKESVYFPLIYFSISLLSWRINHVPTFLFIRGVFVYFKFYLFWYFVRCIGPWSLRERKTMFVGFVLFAVLQTFVNVLLWQKGVLAFNPDWSTGTIGNAHYVGYLSVMSLFLLGGWMLSQSRLFSWGMTAAALAIALISYNLIVLTDTKHVLPLVPLAGVLFLFSSRFPYRRRILLILFGTFFIGAILVFYRLFPDQQPFDVETILQSLRYGGKGAVFNSIVHRLPYETPFFPVGAGPGNFCSANALFSLRPLAVKYVLPYTIWAISGYSPLSSSMMGTPVTGLFTITGEFGPIVAIAYYAFWIYVIRHLWKNAHAETARSPVDAFQIAIACFCILYLCISLVIDIFSSQIFTFMLAAFIGVNWDNLPCSGIEENRAPASDVKVPAIRSLLR